MLNSFFWLLNLVTTNPCDFYIVQLSVFLPYYDDDDDDDDDGDDDDDVQLTHPHF